MTDNLPAPQMPALSAAQQTHVVNILRRAARSEVLPRFRNLSVGDVTQKTGPYDLVTTADLAAEAMITRALHMAFPSALIIGEEAVAADASLLDQITTAPLAFIIDPIDGTSNFADGLALFGMILAVTRYGKPAFGVIYDPIGDDWVIADENTPTRMEHPLKAPRPLRVSMGKSIEKQIGYIQLSVFPAQLRGKVAATYPNFAQASTLRCSAHEYRMLAEGHADFVLRGGNLHPWDHAAGALICAQAGGHVEMLSGGPYDASMRDGYLLAAPDRATWNRLRKMFGFLVD